MSSKNQKRILREAVSSLHHTYKMEFSVKTFNGFKLLNIFTKSLILDVLWVQSLPLI